MVGDSEGDAGDRGGGQAPLEGVLDRLLERTEGEESVGLKDVFGAFSGRLYGPLMLVPSLMLVTPLGGIPGMPIVVAVLLVLVAGQRVLGMSQPWIPKRFRERTVKREKLKAAFEKIRPWAERLDPLFSRRLTVLVEGPMERVIALMIVAVGLSVPVFGLVPMAAAIPGLAAVLLSLAVTARDGLLVLLSWVVIGAGVAGMFWMNGGA
jgi:hypothetical protein